MQQHEPVQERNGCADLMWVVFVIALLLVFMAAVTGLAASMGV
jgi:hypothetical protein